MARFGAVIVGPQGGIETQAQRKEMIMSGGAIGAVGGIGAGLMGGMGAVGQTGMLAQGGVVGRTSIAESVAKPAHPEPSAKVVISEAAQALRAGDGVQNGVSIGELAEVLIVALLLQLMEHKQSS